MIDRRVRLGEALPCVLDAALGVAELLRIFGQEGLDGLLGIASDDVEPRRQRGELSLLHPELGELVLQRLGGVDHGGLGAGLRFDQAGAHVDALLKRRHKLLLACNGLLEHVAFGRLLRPLRVERGERGAKLAYVGRENPIFALAQGEADVGGPFDRRRGRQRPCPRGSQRRLTAQGFDASRGEFRSRCLNIGLGGRPVEFDKNVARLHRAVVRDANARDPASLDRLDDLDPAGRLELALRGGDDVDAAEIGPHESNRDHDANDPEERDMHGRGGRLQDFQGRGKELAVGQTPRTRRPYERARLDPRWSR